MCPRFVFLKFWNLDIVITKNDELKSSIERVSAVAINEETKSKAIKIFIDSNKVNFVITDFKNEISVSYSGSIPNLFEENKGVVAEGYLKDRNFFKADKILAKHDENYMPPEVKEALEEK